jgi:predicted phage tail protein
MFNRKKPPKDILSFERIFPPKKRREIILNDLIAGIITGITYSIYSAFATIGISGAAVMTASGAIANILFYGAVSIALSQITNAVFGQKKNSDASTASNGRIFNTKSALEPLHLLYGTLRVKGNWICLSV